MKQTLLEMVRDILSDMDSDDVNSITDTVEAMQVATILKSCFMEMSSNRNWPNHKRLSQVHHSGTPELPTHLKLPENTKELLFFRYDKSRTDDPSDIEYQDVTYKYPDEFIRMVSNRKPSTDNVKIVTDPSGIRLIIKNNQAPMFWTSFDDAYIVCDGYDASIDDALQKSKTQCLAFFMPKWVHTDDAIPDLPAEAFASLIEEAKSVASISLKQMANEKAEQRAARQSRWLARKAWTAKGGIRYSNYGRKSMK